MGGVGGMLKMGGRGGMESCCLPLHGQTVSVHRIIWLLLVQKHSLCRQKLY